MTVFEAIILGIVQGLTEFLPISSSGHLVLAQHLFGFEKPMVAFDVVLHCGTLLAVLAFLARDVARMVQEGLIFIVRFPFAKDKKDLMREYPYAIILLWVAIATAITAALGFIFQDTIEPFFGSLKVVGIAWILTGVALMFSPKFSNGKRSVYEMNFWDAVSIGFAQAVSIIPGVSRVGLTVLTGMGRGVEQTHAARFSFLIFIPAIMGAGLGSDVAMITDGRFSGGSHGFIIGHVVPEAQEGGPIALVRDGDIIDIDAENNSICVDISDADMQARRKEWTMPAYKATRGTLYKYIKTVKTASEGCVTDE